MTDEEMEKQVNICLGKVMKALEGKHIEIATNTLIGALFSICAQGGIETEEAIDLIKQSVETFPERCSVLLKN